MTKDPGPMQISAKFIKYKAQIIAPLLLNIFIYSNREPDNNHGKRPLLRPFQKRVAINDRNLCREIAIQLVIPEIFNKNVNTDLQRNVVPLPTF